MRQLLMVGRDLNQLMDLTIALRGCSHVTTIAVTDEVVARAMSSASQGPCQIIVCLDESDATMDIRPLNEISPPVLLLTSESASHLYEQLKEAGCLVLAARERGFLISATLLAYEARPVRP